MTARIYRPRFLSPRATDAHMDGRWSEYRTTRARNLIIAAAIFGLLFGVASMTIIGMLPAPHPVRQAIPQEHGNEGAR